jgi:hypothetical protein
LSRILHVVEKTFARDDKHDKQKNKNDNNGPTYTMGDFQASPHRGHMILKDQANNGSSGHLCNDRPTTVQKCGVKELLAKPEQFEKGREGANQQRSCGQQGACS